MVRIIDMECNVPRHTRNAVESSSRQGGVRRRRKCPPWECLRTACRLRHGELWTYLPQSSGG